MTKPPQNVRRSALQLDVAIRQMLSLPQLPYSPKAILLALLYPLLFCTNVILSEKRIVLRRAKPYEVFCSDGECSHCFRLSSSSSNCSVENFARGLLAFFPGIPS